MEMLRRELSDKVKLVLSSRWLKANGINWKFFSTGIPGQRYHKCHLAQEIGLRVKRAETFTYRSLGIRLVGSSASDSKNFTRSSEEIQRVADEKRALLQRKKEIKRLDRVEKQKQQLEKKGEVSSEKNNIRYNIPTKPGDKKDVLHPLPEAYSPCFVEAAWYDWWQSQGYFTPEFASRQPAECDGKTERFVMCLPPPNVTGTLHLGHALGNAIQDAIARWHRMNGRTVLWNPGCDHAGIATQVVVERKLWKEQKLRRQDIGRERFLAEVWKWKAEKGGQIYEQMKRLGSSLDWTRDCFTLDPKLVRAVNEAFVRLFDDGVIYRSRCLVNWSCALSSAISDIEVDNLSLDGRTLLELPGYERKIPFGQIASFSYPIDNSDQKITVSTTRLETMLGDTAIAVHPSDDRFSHLHGKFAWHPFCHRRLPIVCDESVDPAFGTGAVKVTPAHDRNDFALGLRHNLELLMILAEDGTMVNVPEQFQGKKRFDVREEIRKGLEQLGLYCGTADHPMVLPVCSRSKDVVEFLLKDQWFVRCEDLTNKAIQAVENGQLKLIPEHYGKQWKNWLTNTRDWCISRQLWWGHRVPAYRVKQLNENGSNGNGDVWVAAQSSEEAIRKAAALYKIPKDEIIVEQDEDVLDTWFSSALFPFAIFGWPEETDDFKRFYPTTLLETASDIMFFWVARMVMLGEALTGQLPFNEVLFHSILRDAHGRKMSKSLGNIIDPMNLIHGTSLESLYEGVEKSNLDASEIKRAKTGLQRDFPLGIPECGADALRFALCSSNYMGHFINVDVNHVKATRHFCNKIWQTNRFISAHLGVNFTPIDLSKVELHSATDRWILSRLYNVVKTCNDSFASYRLMDATKALHSFWWHELCDVYLEYSKTAMASENQSHVNNVKNVLYFCLESCLRLLSPFMPFLAEELYQRLPDHCVPRCPSIMVAPYPQASEYKFQDEDSEKGMEIVRDIVSGLLSLRRDVGLNKLKAQVYISSADPFVIRALEEHRVAFLTLSKSDTVTLLDSCPPQLSGCISISGKTVDWMANVKLKGLIDEREQLDRLNQQQSKLEEELSKYQRKLADEKTREEDVIIIEEKAKIAMALHARIVNITKALGNLMSDR